MGGRVSLLSSLRKIQHDHRGVPELMSVSSSHVSQEQASLITAAPDHRWGVAHGKCGHSSDPRQISELSSQALGQQHFSLGVYEG